MQLSLPTGQTPEITYLGEGIIRAQVLRLGELGLQQQAGWLLPSERGQVWMGFAKDGHRGQGPERRRLTVTQLSESRLPCR